MPRNEMSVRSNGTLNHDDAQGVKMRELNGHTIGRQPC